MLKTELQLDHGDLQKQNWMIWKKYTMSQMNKRHNVNEELIYQMVAV